MTEQPRTLEDRVGDLENRLSALEARMARVEKNLSAIAKALTEIDPTLLLDRAGYEADTPEDIEDESDDTQAGEDELGLEPDEDP